MMRRFMLIVVALVFASPALAVDVNAVKVGSDVAITYTGGTDVRAFALDITVDNGATITGISGYYDQGEGAGYGIFPGKFRDYIDPADPNWVDPNYNPVAPGGDPGAGGDIPGAAITIELGALYDGAPNQPPVDGNLCVLQIDAPAGDCNVCIAVNDDRGNVVMNDANEATTNLPICRKILFDCYTLVGQQYTDWVELGKPECWCSPYQCDGDADGTTAGLLKRRVWDLDYDALEANWGKRITDPTLDPCADIDHLGAGLLKRRVWDLDYDIMSANWGNRDSEMPGDCPKLR